MKISLERILKKFETFAISHNQIESFETRPLTENIANNFVYPLMWIDVQTLSVSFQKGQLVISVSVYMLDRVERDYSNLVEVLSSNLLKIDDLLTEFGDQECEGEAYGFILNDGASASPVIYEFDDICAGYSSTISIQVGMSKNEDMIPLA